MSIEKTYKVLVTGFEPFDGLDKNTSWETVKYMETSLRWPASIDLITKEFPVIYGTVSEQVPDLWKNINPDLVVHLGVDVGAEYISIEKQAFNKPYTMEDTNNQLPKNKCCKKDGKDVLQTAIDVRDLRIHTNCFCYKKMLQIHCKESDDPGMYLCGFTYYLSLSEDRSKSLFIHVPSDDSKIKIMAQVVQYIIFRCLNSLYNTNFGSIRSFHRTFKLTLVSKLS